MSKRKTIINYALLIFLFLIIGIYAFSRTRNLFAGAHIIVRDVVDGQTFTKELLTIAGTAENTKAFSIDDRPVSLDTKGNFSESLLLSPGRNIISLKAVDRFGHSEEKNYQVYLAKP